MRETLVWTISIPPELAREAAILAQKEKRTRSEMVREALRQYIANRTLEQIQAQAAARVRELNIFNESDVEELIDEIRK
ncbi:MAG: ribbon-helix-helix protein, CopG family [Peptococcaceae bacterium]|nr:ribbon-helix-helix protein, CopG family [Peptococcaceae bacterium]